MKTFSLSRPQYNLTLAIVIASVLALGGVYIVFRSHAATNTADFNNDGVVDVKDLAILAANFDKTGQTGATGDANGDGVVNINDFAILAIQWNTSSGGGTTNPLCTWSGIANRQFPCLADTGIPTGTTLHTNGATPNDCPATINSAAVTAHGSSTWTGCWWTSQVNITAANVTIQNSLFTGGGSGGGTSGSAFNSTASGVIIKYSLFDYGNFGVNDTAHRYATSGCSGGEVMYLSNGTLDHSVVVGWSDGPRLSNNATYSNDYFSGCGLESRGDHADVFQSYGGGCGNVIDHSTLEDGNSGYQMDSADVTFAADGGCGFTVNNSLVVIGPGQNNGNAFGLDMRGDDMHGTITMTNNIFQIGSHTPINCSAGDGTPGPLTYVVSGNKKTDGSSLSPNCVGHL